MAAAVAAAVLLAMVAVPPGRVRGTPALGVSCVIVNLEHTDCSWRHVPSPQSNYTFQSRLGDRGSYSDCPRYLLQGGYTVGCRLPYTLLDRFKTLHLRLTHDSALAWEQTVQLLNQVKLNPPHNLSVEVNRQNQELWLYWNHSVKSNCRENQVMYRRNEESQWQFSTLLPADFYSLPQASLKSQYEFKVKTRVSNTCGMSEFWSDWGPPVWWYPAEQSNQTGPELGVDFQHKDRDAVTPGRKVLYPVMGVGAFLLLITMAVLLVHGESRDEPQLAAPRCPAGGGCAGAALAALTGGGAGAAPCRLSAGH